MKRWAQSVVILAMAMCIGAPAIAADEISYKVVAGDTLTGLGGKYLKRQADYRIVQKRNGIRNPRRIPVGTILKVPRSILKYEPASARLSAVRGDVMAVVDGEARAARTGQTLSEGNALKTSGGAFASLQLDDGSRISVPSNTDIRILRLRRYLLGSALDYDFQVDRGGARSKVAPLKSANDRYQVRTPRAVSAVRGTDFQTRFDADKKRDFAEVDEGGLAIELDKGVTQALPAGNGLAVAADGSSFTEALLPPLDIAGAGKLQNGATVRFALPSAANARISIAKDASFEEQFADRIASDGAVDFGNLDDGNYFLRARAIAPSGIEGLPATYAFKRRLNSVSGSAGAADEGWVFKWGGVGRGVIRYNFQLFRGDIKGVPLVDETGLEAQQIILSDLPDGEYHWRVGSVQYLDGEASANWTAFEKLTVAAN